MLRKLSYEQLEGLLLHTVGINNILVDALINPPKEECPFGKDEPTDINVDILVFNPNCGEGEQPKQNLDAFCGEWKGGRGKSDVIIYKALPGYMIAFGKKSKGAPYDDCYLIQELGGNPCFDAGYGTVVFSHDKEKDTISFYPGGEYVRIEDTKK